MELNSLYILYYEPHNLPNTNKTKENLHSITRKLKKRKGKQKEKHLKPYTNSYILCPQSFPH